MLLVLNCRDVGPRDGDHVLYFGHDSKRPKGREDLIRFDPEKQATAGVTIAIHMSDEDANIWARTFDIAIVLEVLDPNPDNSYSCRHLQVQYYKCLGVVPDCPTTSKKFRSEQVQLNMKWALTDWKGVVPWTCVINEQFVQDNGKLYKRWRESLRYEIQRHHDAVDDYS